MAHAVPLLVIGAGPFGLAIAAHARRRGIEAGIVGWPMSFWQGHMPAGMYLRSGVDWHLDAAGEWTIARFLAEHEVRPEAVTPFALRTYLQYADCSRRISIFAMPRSRDWRDRATDASWRRSMTARS